MRELCANICHYSHVLQSSCASKCISLPLQVFHQADVGEYLRSEDDL